MSLYDDVEKVAINYLGPAGGRFVRRQITGHMNIEESQLSAHHLEELAKWCYVSGKLLMSDDQAREFSNKVKALKQ